MSEITGARITKFKEASIRELAEEFDCDFLPAPFLVPVQGGGFKIDAAIQIVDKKRISPCVRHSWMIMENLYERNIRKTETRS